MYKVLFIICNALIVLLVLNTKLGIIILSIIIPIFLISNLIYNRSLQNTCPFCKNSAIIFQENIELGYICDNCKSIINPTIRIKKIIFDFGYGYENNLKEIKIFSLLDLIKEIKDYSEIYLDISKYSGEDIKRFIVDLINNPSKRGLKKVKLFIKGENKESPANIYNIIGKDNFITIKNYALDAGQISFHEPFTLSFQFDENTDLHKKIKFSEIYINTSPTYHEVIEKLITYLMENYTQKEISNMKLIVEGSLDELAINLKNAIGNNFKIEMND